MGRIKNIKGITRGKETRYLQYLEKELRGGAGVLDRDRFLKRVGK